MEGQEGPGDDMLRNCSYVPKVMGTTVGFMPDCDMVEICISGRTSL